MSRWPLDWNHFASNGVSKVDTNRIVPDLCGYLFRCHASSLSFLFSACPCPPLDGKNVIPKPDRVCADLTPAQATMVREGVALHDARRYDEAIAKYQQVLAEEPWLVTALHELSYSYFESRRFSEALEVGMRGVQCRTEGPSQFPILIGNALDELGRSKEAIAVYEEAIRRAPEQAMPRYNLAVALQRAGRLPQAKAAVQRALALNPTHAGSHAVLGDVYRQMGYRIPAALAYARFLQLEPEGPRAKKALPLLEAALAGNVTQGEDANHIKITMVETRKSLKDEGDFGPAELMISIVKAGDLIVDASKEAPKKSTPFEKRASLVSVFCEALANSHPKGGFAAKFYAPYFAALQKAGHAEALAARVWQAAPVEGQMEWAKENGTKMDALAAWSADYAWTGQ